METRIALSSLAALLLQGRIHLSQIEKKASETVVYTTVSISREAKKVRANYKLPRIFRLLIGEKFATYLEHFDIHLDQKEHGEFTINHIFRNWPQSADFLKPVSLNGYFGQNAHQETPISLLNNQSIDVFKQVEADLLDKVVDYYQMQEGYYLPIPVEHNGDLQHVIYLIYDAKTLSQESVDFINAICLSLERLYG